MNGSRKEQFLTEENINIISAMALELCAFYKEKYAHNFASGKYVRNALTKTMRYYADYLRKFDCKVTTVDFYKVYSWLGFFLAQELSSQDLRYRILRVAVWIMFDRLGIKEDMFDSYCVKKILSMLQNEIDSNSDFGIGKNGLYMIMKFASITNHPQT